jgi:hypothetical protein
MKFPRQWSMEAVLIVVLALSFAMVLVIDREPYDNQPVVVERSEAPPLRMLRLPARDHALDPSRNAE